MQAPLQRRVQQRQLPQVPLSNMRILAFITLLCLLPLLPFWLSLLATTLYLLRWQGIEILFVMFAIDAFFANHAAAPYYLLSATTIACAVALVRPLLMFYND